MNPQGPGRESPLEARLLLLTHALLLWVFCVLVRLAWLQIYTHDELAQQASQQQEHSVSIPALRGAILDRSGEPLAMSLPSISVGVHPARVPDLHLAAAIFARNLALNEDDLYSKLKQARDADGKHPFIYIKKKLSNEEAEALKSYRFDWIEWDPSSQRYYPNQGLASHVLGGVRSDQTGAGGLEAKLNAELTGMPGKMVTLSDSRQRSLDSQVVQPPKPGVNVTLTIHRELQHIAERELRAGIAATHTQTGTIVVMDPRNGDILAMASYPDYNPNEAVEDRRQVEARNNLAITTPFEPGSVFKVITLSAGLETRKVTPDTPIDCGRGVWTYMKRTIHDTHALGVVPVHKVLSQSSNIGAGQIGLRVGDETLLEFVRRFGFGKSTGVPLPAESGGLVRRLDHWTKTSIASVAMGQEVSVTSLQLARAAAVIANGGLLVKPRLIWKKQRPGQAAQEMPLDLPERVIRPETSIAMRRMMEEVVLEGTGRTARLIGYTAAGKTGTAQIFDRVHHQYLHQYNASFIGFAPVQNPTVVIAVTLSPSSGYAAAVAAPVFQKVATEALRILDTPRDLPDDFVPPKLDAKLPEPIELADFESAVDVPSLDDAEPVLSPAILPVIGPRVPEFRGRSMREVVQLAAEQGLPVEINGRGVARAQSPAPHAYLAPGERVRVLFAR